MISPIKTQQAVLRRSGEAVVPGVWSPTLQASFIRGADLIGKRVLEMGSNTGGLSLELARRGARVHSAEPIIATDEARNIAATEGLEIEWSKTDLFGSHSLGSFDTIVCFGLIYHFRHPQFVLDYLSSLGAPVLYLSSQTRAGSGLVLHNRAEFYPKFAAKNRVRGYEPTHQMMQAMMRASGFGKIELLTDREYDAPNIPAGQTNSAYYRGELECRVDPDALARIFEPPMPAAGR